MDGNLVLSRITPSEEDEENEVTEEEIFKKKLGYSTIEACKINNVVVKTKCYKGILDDDLYPTMTTETISQNTRLNILQEERHDKGFKYYRNLGLSIRCANTDKILKELTRIIKIKNYSMELKIKLANDEVILYKIGV
jgi:hypothetical protein